jgi:hypothetical protein
LVCGLAIVPAEKGIRRAREREKGKYAIMP